MVGIPFDRCGVRTEHGAELDVLCVGILREVVGAIEDERRTIADRTRTRGVAWKCIALDGSVVLLARIVRPVRGGVAIAGLAAIEVRGGAPGAAGCRKQRGGDDRDPRSR